jgi:ABC-2 type transport system permease protein
MSRPRAIWLVARREVIERGKSRGFLFSVAFTTVAIIGFIIVPTILASDESERRIGILADAPSGLTDALETHAQALGYEVEVRTVDDPDAALEAGDVEVVVELPADLSGPGSLRFRDDVDEGLGQVAASGVIAVRTDALLESAGIGSDALATAQTPPVVVVVDPPDPDRDARLLFGHIGAVLILVAIFGFGFTLLTGVVEEKQSRVVEVVLATVRARDLLMGKVLGIGILGLVQLVVFVGAALAAAMLTQAIALPTTTPGAIAVLVLWFVLGYAMYATVLGAAGSLASRMEEASNLTTPVTLVAILSYFVAIFGVLEDPAGPVAVVATFVPVTAPFVVPLRAALDAIPAWELLLSVVVMVATIWVLFDVGARIYTGAVLQTAGRIKLRDAWRSGR